AGGGHGAGAALRTGTLVGGQARRRAGLVAARLACGGGTGHSGRGATLTRGELAGAAAPQIHQADAAREPAPVVRGRRAEFAAAMAASGQEVAARLLPELADGRASLAGGAALGGPVRVAALLGG